MTSPNKDVDICKKCGYVVPKEEAEHSSTHVHCPRCGKIIARYIK